MTDNTVDILGRKVSGKGYLIDDAYNIVKYDEQGNAKIMFKFCVLSAIRSNYLH